MKSFFTLLACTLLGTGLFAQALKLPEPSPKASTSFTVGLTEITIKYSSPAVKDRAIWGNMLPYDQVWRAGANEATTIQFSTDVMLEGKTLDAGRYAFFLIPRKEGDWTLIFNKDADQWGAYNYDESKDALRIDVPVEKVEHSKERLTYHISDEGQGDEAIITLAWEHIRLRFRVNVEVKKTAMANIEKGLPTIPEDRKWQAYAQAAEYLMGVDELDKALEYAKESTAKYNHTWNWWLRAQIEGRKGEYKAAYASAEKAKAYGIANNSNYYQGNKDDIEEALNTWKNKM